MLFPFEITGATDMIKYKCIYNWFSGLKVSYSLFVLEEKKPGWCLSCRKFQKRNKVQKFIHHLSGYSVLLCYSCSVIYMAPLKPGVLSLLSHLGREQSWFPLLAQRIELSIIFMGAGNRALSLYSPV